MDDEPEQRSLRETVLDGRIRLTSVLALPPLGFAALFTDVWLRFPAIFPDKPDGRLAMAILAGLGVAAAAFGVLVARRARWRPARWRTLAHRFLMIEAVATVVAGPAYGFIVVENSVVRAFVVGGSAALVRPLFWITRLAASGADAIAALPAADVAGTELEVLIPPYRMTVLDETLGWRARRNYRRQLRLKPLYLGVGVDSLWLDTEGSDIVGTSKIARLPLVQVTNVAIRMITTDHHYRPAGSRQALEVCQGAVVAITFGEQGEWLFPCPVDGDNVVDLIRLRAAAERKRRPRGKRIRNSHT